MKEDKILEHPVRLIAQFCTSLLFTTLLGVAALVTRMRRIDGPAQENEATYWRKRSVVPPSISESRRQY